MSEKGDFTNGRTLCLLATITFTSFFVSLFSGLLGFGEALFSTVSLPVVYTIRYFSKSASGELIGLFSAYVIGYLMFLATTQIFGDYGMVIYSLAFIASILMRICIYTIYNSLPKEFDKENPFFAVFTAVFLSAVFAGVLVLWTQ